MIHKTNHAPLGRPPTDPKARQIYNASKRKPTAHGEKITAHKVNVYRKQQEREDKKTREMYRYMNQKDEYELYRIGQDLRNGRIVLEDVDAELEDMGYIDHDKNFRRKGSAKRIQAWQRMKTR